MNNARISLARRRFNQRRRESLLAKFAEQIVLPMVVCFGAGVLVALSAVEGRAADVACNEMPHVTPDRRAVASVFGED